MAIKEEEEKKKPSGFDVDAGYKFHTLSKVSQEPRRKKGIYEPNVMKSASAKSVNLLLCNRGNSDK